MTNNYILKGRVEDSLRLTPNGTYDLICADPPFNIGYNYDQYRDNLTIKDYLSWTEDWTRQCVRVLKPTGSFWTCIGPKYASELNVILKSIGLHQRNYIIWNYEFGRSMANMFSPCSTHILYHTKSETEFMFRPDAIKIPSLRQTKYNDARAKDSGKVPSDVWNIPRLCGTFSERIKDPLTGASLHGCQMPLALTDRIILATTEPGNTILEPFAGTGTFSVSAKRFGRNSVGYDISEDYVKIANDRLIATKSLFED